MSRAPRTAAPLAAALILVLAAAAGAQGWERGGGVSEMRTVTLASTGASRITVRARAGNLRVVGTDGGEEVRARGVARASSRTLLEKVQLRAERHGDELHIEVETPHQLQEGEFAGLDLTVQVPARLAVAVSDGSGDATVRGVAELTVEDGSGDLQVEEVLRHVRITDGSGDVHVRDVRGNVELTDGSGSVRIRGVRGSVVVQQDGSGEFVAESVRGSVLVRSKGSGTLQVVDIGGDFVVERKGSGSVSHREVRGRVAVPERRRGRERERERDRERDRERHE